MATTITPMDITGGATPQTAAVDATPAQVVEAAPEPAKPADPLSPKFAALARQQKQLRQQQIEIQEAKKAIEADRQAIDQSRLWKQRLTQDPYGVMLEAGLTADQVAALMLQQPNPEDQKFSQIQQELKAVKEAQERARLEAESTQKRQYEDAVKQIRSDVDALVTADESYETIKAMNASEAVVALIEETFNKDGRLMSIEEAAKEVEEYLAEEAMKFMSLKKIQAKFTPAPQAVPEKQILNTQPQPQQLRTLSNRASTVVAAPLTDKQRRERAILAFQGKLT